MWRFRTLLVLGRVSNLPTVWSNCLAGWWLAGAGNPGKLPFLLVGTTFLYTGGMFLNDAFDVKFDFLNRPERPIPSGAISLTAVWRWAIGFLALGSLSLILAGRQTGTCGAVLLVCIVVYDAIHKRIAFSPVLMAACRFMVYLAAASTGVFGINGTAIWCGLALAFYVLGLSCLARTESTGAQALSPAAFLLGIPILLALILNAQPFRKMALLLALVLGLCILLSLAPLMLWPHKRSVSRTVSRLLAGIVFADWLACLVVTRDLALIFIFLFLVTLFLQRFVPAT